MTKMIKLSLVAAVAVAGFATTVSANDLKISGGIAYKLDKKDGTTPETEEWSHYYKTSIVMKKAVNDKITAAVSYAARPTDTDQLNGAPAGLSNAKFMYKNGGTHAVLGRQGITTPWTNGSSAIDGTNVGSGIIASHHFGAVTVVGAHIGNHNIVLGSDATLDAAATAAATAATAAAATYTATATLANYDASQKANAASTTAAAAAEAAKNGTKNNNLTVLAAIAKVGPAKLQLWHLNVAEADDNKFDASATTVIADVNIKGVGVNVRHSMAKINGGDNQTLTSVSVKAKAGKVSINAGIAMGGKDGSQVAFDSAGNAGNQQYLGTWNLSLGGKKSEQTLMALGASMPINNTFTGIVNFGTQNTKGATSATDADVTELKLQVSAKVAKNTSAYLRHAVMGGDNTFDSRTRLYLAYKF